MVQSCSRSNGYCLLLHLGLRLGLGTKCNVGLRPDLHTALGSGFARLTFGAIGPKGVIT